MVRAWPAQGVSSRDGFRGVLLTCQVERSAVVLPNAVRSGTKIVGMHLVYRYQTTN